MKKILLVSLITFASFAHAAPNVWQSSYAQGFIEYSIQDTKGNTLWVVCNEGAGDDYDHSANLQTKKNRYQNTDSKYPLSFLLDGKISVAPAGSPVRFNSINLNRVKNSIFASIVQT